MQAKGCVHTQVHGHIQIHRRVHSSTNTNMNTLVHRYTYHLNKPASLQAHIQSLHISSTCIHWVMPKKVDFLSLRGQLCESENIAGGRRTKQEALLQREAEDSWCPTPLGVFVSCPVPIPAIGSYIFPQVGERQRESLHQEGEKL